MSFNIISQYAEENTAVKLGQGIHENVVLRKITVGQFKNAKGEKGAQNMEILVSQVDPEKDSKLLKETNFMFFPRKSDSKDLLRSVFNEMLRLNEILLCFMDKETADERFNPFEAIGFTGKTYNEAIKFLKKPSMLKDFNTAYPQLFKNALEPYIGLKSPYRVRLKVLKDGKYYKLGYSPFVETMNIPIEKKNVTWTDYELELMAQSLRQIKPDNIPNVSGGTGVPGAPRIPGVPGSAGLPGICGAAKPPMPNAAPTQTTAPGVSPASVGSYQSTQKPVTAQPEMGKVVDNPMNAGQATQTPANSYPGTAVPQPTYQTAPQPVQQPVQQEVLKIPGVPVQAFLNPAAGITSDNPLGNMNLDMAGNEINGAQSGNNSNLPF